MKEVRPDASGTDGAVCHKHAGESTRKEVLKADECELTIDEAVYFWVIFIRQTSTDTGRVKKTANAYTQKRAARNFN